MRNLLRFEKWGLMESEGDLNSLSYGITKKQFDEFISEAKNMELEQMHEAYMAGAKDVQELIQKQAIEEINRLNSDG